jgi:hypothetical protein
MAATRGGVASSLGRGGAGRQPRHRATGVDERGFGDSDGGAPVTAMTNFGSLAV